MTNEEQEEGSNSPQSPIRPMLSLEPVTTSQEQPQANTGTTPTNAVNPISLLWHPTLSTDDEQTKQQPTDAVEDEAIPTAHKEVTGGEGGRPETTAPVKPMTQTPQLAAPVQTIMQTPQFAPTAQPITPMPQFTPPAQPTMPTPQFTPQVQPVMFTPQFATPIHSTMPVPQPNPPTQTPQVQPVSQTPQLIQSTYPIYNPTHFSNHPPYIPPFVNPWNHQLQQPGTPFTFPFNPFQPTQPNPVLHRPMLRSVTSPFVKELLDYEIPNTSKLPTLRTYNGTTDPDSHIDTYEWHMTSLKLDERFWCTYFPTTLDGNAGTWFKTLKPNTIHNFDQLKQLFLTNFMQLRKYKGNNHAIIGCKQREGESVKDYFKRFTKAALDVPGQDESLVTGAFTWGLLPGELSKKFLGRPPQNRHDLKERVERFLRQEDGTAEKQAYLKATTEQRPRHGERQGYNGRQPYRNNRTPRRYQPYNREDRRYGRPEVYAVAERTDERNITKEKAKYCEYHRSRTHNTADCTMLRREIEEKQLKGNLTEIARDLRAKQDANQNNQRNNREGNRRGNRNHEILAVTTHRDEERRETRQREPGVLEINFSADDPRPQRWNGDDPLIIKGYMGRSQVHRIYVDGGSAADIMYEHCFRELPREWKEELQPTTERLTGFTGHSICPLGMIKLPLSLYSYDGRRKKTALIEFLVVRTSSEYNIILGRTGMLRFGAVASTVHGVLKFSTPRGTATVMATPLQTLQCHQIMAPKELTRSHKRSKPGTPEERVIVNTAFPEQTIRIGTDLPKQTREDLIKLLQRYIHVFAWEPTDMVGVSREIIEHGLNVEPGSSTIKQKKRGQGLDKNAAINEEVAKLVAAGILREAVFPTWIANPVMVKKSDGSWRMCIDYTDLNKACPKDCYPLPEIDQKVESLQGFRWKCFLDAYKGYHQILMKKQDEEKTAFYTDHGTFCYTKMPFGLKNAGATYQRLVDKVFKDQIGRNIEVYVDDMVIKSRNEETLIADVEETLQTLDKIQMKLNPAKCTFGVEQGQFLGYYITTEGIQANPSKVENLLQTEPPSNLRDMQALNGKLTALGRFLAKSAEKALPLFQTLKGCIEKSKFKWTTEAEEALEKLKEALHRLPTLASPIPGETLSIYLSTSAEAISAALLVDRGDTQLPIYFVSRALQGAEINYPALEKLALALVYAARRLRRYFQAHHIEVLTDQPLRHVLLKPEKSGRLAKWAIELGEHDIEYRPRTSIKGQALADFLCEIPANIKTKPTVLDSKQGKGQEKTEVWTLHTDGASSKEGSGAGLILRDPKGEEMTYALRFDFQTSNNEAEYEALLAGLRLAREVGAKHVEAYSDSMLVANQVNGTYEAKDDRMQQYVDTVKKLTKSFETFTIKQISRSNNKRADALSKLASMAYDHLTKKVLVEILPRRSIEERQIHILETEGTTWMIPYYDYLKHGVLPENPDEARKIKIKAPQFTIKNDVLYRKGYLAPWLKCISTTEGKRALQETHDGPAGAHEGTRALTGKVLRMGLYWPSIHKDATEITKKCVPCQTFSPVQNLPATNMTSIASPWPFHQWGIDIVGPFPEAPGKVKFLVVAVDYFTKWIEAEPLATISGRAMIKFLWKNIITRFGTPKILISDNGLQFAENPFRGWCEERRIEQRFTSVAHPQANGQTEVSNRTVVNGLKKRLGKAKGNWVEELPSVLWSYRTTPRTSTNETPFSLAYGTEAVLPPEVMVGSLRTDEFNEEQTEENLRHNLDLLEEKREAAQLRQAAYKASVEKYYNARVQGKAFKVGDLVLRKNEASRAQPQGKLGPTWEGPYKVVEAHREGSYVLEAMDGRAIPRTWNAKNLRHFFV